MSFTLHLYQIWTLEPYTSYNYHDKAQENYTSWYWPLINLLHKNFKNWNNLGKIWTKHYTLHNCTYLLSKIYKFWDFTTEAKQPYEISTLTNFKEEFCYNKNRKKEKHKLQRRIISPILNITILYNLRKVRSRYNCLSNTSKKITQVWPNIILYIKLETISFVACILQFDYNFICIECAVSFKFYPITDNSRVIYRVHDFCLNQLKIYA